MRVTAESRSLKVGIKRDVDDAYVFLCKPENFSQWASGLGELLRTGAAR